MIDEEKTKAEIKEYLNTLIDLINKINEKYIFRVREFHPIEEHIDLGIFTKDKPLIGITGHPYRMGCVTRIKYPMGDDL